MGNKIHRNKRLTEITTTEAAQCPDEEITLPNRPFTSSDSIFKTYSMGGITNDKSSPRTLMKTNSISSISTTSSVLSHNSLSYSNFVEEFIGIESKNNIPHCDIVEEDFDELDIISYSNTSTQQQPSIIVDLDLEKLKKRREDKAKSESGDASSIKDKAVKEQKKQRLAALLKRKSESCSSLSSKKKDENVC
ncbi:hypothetical protein ABK040_004892 [Willaertia magna]